MVSSIYSFIVDAGPLFSYQGYHLAQSLITHVAPNPADVHVQLTPRAPKSAGEIFRELGCTTHELAPFGDGKFCNKISQLDNLVETQSDCIVMLDTDTIVVGDFRKFLNTKAMLAKIVDLGNPPSATLKQIAEAAKMEAMPPLLPTDAGDGSTYLGNCNGGFYSVPRSLLGTVRANWRKWAMWLIENPEPLKTVGKTDHVDQVAMWLAIHMDKIPFLPCFANVNYFVHLSAPHRYYMEQHPIYLLHYHRNLDVHGLILPASPIHRAGADAVKRANQQIARHFNNRVFWDWRYDQHPERGSGLGSTGKNLEFKRQLLASEGIEAAESVLDVGCGNLEVMKGFQMRGYLGLDQSEAAIAKARVARPDWEFRAVNVVMEAHSIASADLVVCFEVLIHQETREKYEGLVRVLAEKTKRTLIVSGYDVPNPEVSNYHMIFFHEPLRQSLEKSGRFGTIQQIGAHTDVVIYRCEV
jgi:hypothetical protein